VEDYLVANPPELLLLNCGADSLAGDPITHLAYSENAHGHAATRLRELAEQFCGGKVLGMGGGGYDRTNLARAWTRSVEGFLDSPSALA
jgi:acetoin utilization protein AcuC